MPEIQHNRLIIRHIRKLTFSGLRVFDAMRVRVVCLQGSNTIEESIRQFIKQKVAAILITDPQKIPIGVVSKTEIIAAYYGDLPLDMMLHDIMSSPVLCCASDDSLEDALVLMQENGVHRLYVVDSMDGKAVGTLAYPDIVGLLYKYCHVCERGLLNKGEEAVETDMIQRLCVRDVMTRNVKSMSQEVGLSLIVEELAMSRLGAILLFGDAEVPVGVVSKTDLTLAYKRGVSNQSSAKDIMSITVHTCREDETLEQALRTMIHSDFSRLFVYKDDPTKITGIFTLSDGARARSGSCEACASSRITPAN